MLVHKQKLLRDLHLQKVEMEAEVSRPSLRLSVYSPLPVTQYRRLVAVAGSGPL